MIFISTDGTPFTVNNTIVFDSNIWYNSIIKQNGFTVVKLVIY